MFEVSTNLFLINRISFAMPIKSTIRKIEKIKPKIAMYISISINIINYFLRRLA